MDLAYGNSLKFYSSLILYFLVKSLSNFVIINIQTNDTTVIIHSRVMDYKYIDNKPYLSQANAQIILVLDMSSLFLPFSCTF